MPEQAQGWCGSPVMYKGMWDVLAKAVEKEGVKGLYKVVPPPSKPKAQYRAFDGHLPCEMLRRRRSGVARQP